MNILLIILVVLAGLLIYAAWQNEWDWKVTIAALGTAGVAAWEAFKGAL